MDRHVSRSPSPNPAQLNTGGWSSPVIGLASSSSPRLISSTSRSTSPLPTREVNWSTAQARSAHVNGNAKHHGSGGGGGSGGLYHSSSQHSPGTIGWVLGKAAGVLPRGWTGRDGGDGGYTVKEKWSPPRNRKGTTGNRIFAWVNHLLKMVLRLRIRNVLLVVGAVLFFVFFSKPLRYRWRRTSWLGGGSKYVVILAANQGGGVMEWKGPREWAIERDSVRNKKKYVARWGYELEIVDMSTKKRYAHEWRESWEKVDTIRNAMRKYPKAEWFWWLDLNTFIMEPSYSLQSHIFNNPARALYRDINHFNPLNITHPPTAEYLDEETRSPIGDGKFSSVNMIIPQDCSGFNLGSFFVRRSAWSDRLLDIWWDPVGYEQKHMEWEHKEQDALEAMYTNQPWVRTKMAFIHQRMINSFPPGACGENGDDPHIHYKEADRDFLVNMAGCEWGRDCWGEIYHYRELSNMLNRTPWEKFKDWLQAAVKKARGQKVDPNGNS